MCINEAFFFFFFFFLGEYGSYLRRKSIFYVVNMLVISVERALCEQSFTDMALNLCQKQTGISLSGSSSCFRLKTQRVPQTKRFTRF
jgi:hypothetical protein